MLQGQGHHSLALAASEAKALTRKSRQHCLDRPRTPGLNSGSRGSRFQEKRTMRPRPFGLATLGAMLIAFASFANAMAANTTTTAPVPFKPPEITADSRAAGKKAVPALLTAANLPCQMADARFIGPTTDPKTKKEVKYYEVACTGAMGYIVVDKGKDGPPAWALCPEMPRTDPATGKVQVGACFLPGNLD